jgi:hypothetical protein
MKNALESDFLVEKPLQKAKRQCRLGALTAIIICAVVYSWFSMTNFTWNYNNNFVQSVSSDMELVEKVTKPITVPSELIKLTSAGSVTLATTVTESSDVPVMEYRIYSNVKITDFLEIEYSFNEKTFAFNVKSPARLDPNVRVRVEMDLKLPAGLKLAKLESKVSAGSLNWSSRAIIDDIAAAHMAGFVELSNLNSKKLNLQVNAGNVGLANSDIYSLFIDTNSGSVKFNNVNARMSDVQVSTGSVKGSIGNFSNFRVVTNTGSLDLDLDAKDAETIKLDAKVGSIKGRISNFAGKFKVNSYVGSCKVEGELVTKSKVQKGFTSCLIEGMVASGHSSFVGETNTGSINVEF